MNKYSKILTYFIIISIVYCVFTITYFLINRDSQDRLIKDYQNSIVNQLNLINMLIDKLDDKDDIPFAISKASKSVVGIYIITEEGIEITNEESTGSGFIIDEEGYIVTNYHVIKNAGLDKNNKDNKIILIKMYGGKSFEVSLDSIFFDSLTDLAIFKINTDSMDLLEAGDSDKVKIGEKVIALGNPLGLFDISFEPTATQGIISGKNINFGLDEDFGSVYKDMIQTDASINPGNSGGPLLNKYGKVIGINTFIITGSDEYKGSVGLNFAIPINRAINIVNELKKNGKIDRKWNTGIELMDINEVIKKIWKPYLSGIDKGVIVTDVEKKSSSEKAGLKKLDVILELNGKKIISVKDYENRILEDEKKAGDIIELLILRNNETKLITLELEKGKFNDW